MAVIIVVMMVIGYLLGLRLLPPVLLSEPESCSRENNFLYALARPLFRRGTLVWAVSCSIWYNYFPWSMV